MRAVYFILTIFLLSFTSVSAQVYYVSLSGDDNNAGTNWGSPYKSIQKALSVATFNSKIFVERGTYYPDQGFLTTALDRNASFVLKNGVSMYGGFAPLLGIVDLTSTRISRSVLSGDLHSNDDLFAGNTENSFHVVTAESIEAGTVFDGFDVRGGNANGGGLNAVGGGMIMSASSLAITNCRFQYSYASKGGGMYIADGSVPILTKCYFAFNNAADGGGLCNLSSSTVIDNCLLFSNAAVNSGGGMYNEQSQPVSRNSVFTQNSAKWGAGIANKASAASVINCLFTSNSASFHGGGMHNETASPQVTNCTFSGNAAALSGAAMYNFYYSSPVIKNSIAWNNNAPAFPEIANGDANDNPQIAYSIVKGGYIGLGNKNEDPQFRSGTDLRLQECSPAIDAGNNAALPVGANTDLDAEQRIVHNIVDMGAYEYSGDLFTYYRDADGDGMGDASNYIESFCSVAPEGYVDNGDDCGDNHIGDCVSCVMPVLYPDNDNDGYGDGSSPWNNAPCSDYGPGSGWSEVGGDCNDGNRDINPGATEICGNSMDDNCNGQTDENCEACGQFSNLSTTDITSTSAKFNWAAQVDPDMWQVQYKSTAPGSKWVDVAGVLPAHRSVTVTGLRNNQNYMWHIRAKCTGTGWTKNSNSVAFATGSNDLMVGSRMSVTVSGDAMAALGVHPNPTRGSFVISLYLDEVMQGQATIRLFDISGKLVETAKANVLNTRLYKTMVLPATAANGLYLVQISIASKIYKTTVLYSK